MKINGRNVTDFTNDELEYTRRDLVEVIEAQETFEPAGLAKPRKLDQYRDELHEVAGELARRKGLGLIRVTLQKRQAETLLDCAYAMLATLSETDVAAKNLLVSTISRLTAAGGAR